MATRSFLIDPRGTNRYSLPIISLATDRKNFFDPNIGIYVCGNTPGCNYAQAGDDWERPVHIEMFETNGLTAFAQDSGIRMHGNTSFGFPIKALRLHPLNAKNGKPFQYQIFPDLPIKEFNRLLLRPSGHDYYLTMMRDGLMQNLVRETGLDMQGYRPAVVFLNGEYWGIHNIQEAYENQYFASHHPEVDPNAVDYIEGYAPSPYAYYGDAIHFNNVIAYMQANDLSLDPNYAYVQTQIEVPDYIDYKVAETFYYRWDIGNHRLWRPRTPDGRWRWILFDCDVGFGGFWSVPPAWAFNMLAYNTEPNGPWTQYEANPGGNDHNAPPITFQLRALLTNAGFKRDFINRFADLMNSSLSTQRMTNFINRMAGQIAPEMAEHTRRWRMPADTIAWNANVQALRDFAINRAQYQRQHITNKFGLGGLANISLKVSDTNQGAIRLSTLIVSAPTNAPWTGVYFRGNPITLTALPAPGYRFKSWTGIFTPSNSFTLLPIIASYSFTANFEAIPPTNFPPAWDLAGGPYSFTEWSASQQAGTYPANMVFLQTTNFDPGLGIEPDALWTLPYDRTNRSRINGLGPDGVAFVNTTEPQPDGGGYLGAAVLAIKTTGQTNIQVTWTGGTVAPNIRVYALRLQYRTNVTSAWSDVLDASGQPCEYVRNNAAGHSQVLSATLPAAANNQPYLQLRWKYYYVSGTGGSRAQLRLDDILADVQAGSAPVFHVSQALVGALNFGVAGAPNQSYLLQTSTNLVQWTTLWITNTGPSGAFEFTEPASNAPSRFFRLRTP